ncbi:NAD(P)H-dependent oxidoreductase subunit E [Planctomycetota bacterium]
MTNVADTLGLCSTCNYAATCAYLKMRGYHVLQCESFEASSEPDTPTTAEREAPAVAVAVAPPPVAEPEAEAPPLLRDELFEKHHERHGQLLALLEEAQRTYGYLPHTALRQVAERTGRSLVDVYGVATFYKTFSLKPRGKHLISVCLGTACHVRGGPGIVDEFETSLGIRSGETTADMEFTLESVNCLGACALGPVVVIDGHNFPHVKRAQVEKIIGKAREGLDAVTATDDPRMIPLSVSCSRCNHSLMDAEWPLDGHPSVKVTASFHDKHLALHLSSLYGSYTLEPRCELPPNEELSFFCPYCHTELNGSVTCAACNARMVPMIVRGGGIVQFCSREGCKVHLLDLG